MPSDLVKRVNLDLLYLPFCMRVLDLVDVCKKRGAYYYLTYGYRSFPEQAKLYFQGRTLPGPKVTNAPAGYSPHNYGIAVDCVRDEDLARVGLQPYWAKDGYDVLAQEAEKLGLQAGVPGLADYGHIQIPLAPRLAPHEKDVLEGFRKIYQASAHGEELAAVFKHFDEIDLLPE